MALSGEDKRRSRNTIRWSRMAIVELRMVMLSRANFPHRSLISDISDVSDQSGANEVVQIGGKTTYVAGGYVVS